MLKEWLVRASIAGAAILIALGLIEAALQLIDFPRSDIPHQRLFVEYDETRGWRNIPNAGGRYSSKEYSVWLKYNSHGIRGQERTYAKPPGVYRILIVGDSFVEGYSVEENERVTEVLEGSLAAKMDRSVQVIALGTAGYSTDQELLWLESEGLKYQPDLVVLMFYYNDVWFNDQPSYWRGGKPLFELDSGSLRLTNVPVSRKMFDESRDTVLQSDSNVQFAGPKIFNLVSRAFQNSNWRGIGAKLGLIQLPPEQSIITRYNVPVLNELTVYRKDAAPEISHAWDITRGLLKQMKTDSEKIGASFLIFYVPSKMEIYPEDWAIFESNYSLQDNNWDARQVANDVIEACQTIAAQCIDPLDQFIVKQGEFKKNGARLYFTTDEHWNASGHQLAASILADYVLTHLQVSR